MVIDGIGLSRSRYGADSWLGVWLKPKQLDRLVRLVQLAAPNVVDFTLINGGWRYQRLISHLVYSWPHLRQFRFHDNDDYHACKERTYDAVGKFTGRAVRYIKSSGGGNSIVDALLNEQVPVIERGAPLALATGWSAHWQPTGRLQAALDRVAAPKVVSTGAQ